MANLVSVKAFSFYFRECAKLMLKCIVRCPQHILSLYKFITVSPVSLKKRNAESHFFQICMQLKLRNDNLTSDRRNKQSKKK